MADFTMTFTITGAKMPDFKAAFLALHPIPAGWAGTERQWIRRRIKQFIMEGYRMGKLQAAVAALPDGEDVISDT